MGATGIEPMTSTVSMDAGLAMLVIRLGSLCAILVHFARYSAPIVPKLFPSFFLVQFVILVRVRSPAIRRTTSHNRIRSWLIQLRRVRGGCSFLK
jgi:hypothetical protein